MIPPSAKIVVAITTSRSPILPIRSLFTYVPLKLSMSSTNAKDVIRLTANSDYAACWNYFTQDTLLKLKS
jgi:hypothetical protein